MLPPPATSHQPDTAVRNPQGPVRRSSPLGNFFFAITWISLIVSTVFFIVTWVTVVPDARFIDNQGPSNISGLSVRGHCIQLDLNARTLTILWTVNPCDVRTSLAVGPTHVPEDCGPSDRALDVYINDPSKPTFQYRPYELIGGSFDVRDQLTFTTGHRIDGYGKWDSAQQLTAPFDRYSFRAFVFAIDPATNRSVSVVSFAVVDALGDFIVRSHGATVTSKFTYDSGDGPATVEVESRVLQAEIKRSAIVKAFTVCLFFVNWSLTVGSVYITVLVALGKLRVNSMVAGLPFSALLTVPAIRSLYSTSPPLGISIDAVAFFVQVAIVALCTLVLLKVFTRYRSSSPPTEYPA